MHTLNKKDVLDNVKLIHKIMQFTVTTVKQLQNFQSISHYFWCELQINEIVFSLNSIAQSKG